MFALPVAILVGLFWSVMVLFREFFKLIRNPIQYLCNDNFITYPEELFTGLFSYHRFALLPTGIRLHYVECGDSSKPLMLFLHGFPEFWYSWRHQMQHFQDDYRVVAVDLRGYGLSDKPQDASHYRINKLVEDVHHLIRHLDVKRCHLVAHDWGGIIAWRFATQHPDMVESLVAMNIPHPRAWTRGFSFQQFLKSWYVFFFQLPYFPEFVLSRNAYAAIADIFTKPPSGLRLRSMPEKDKTAFRANFMIPGACTAAINYYRAIIRYQSQRQEKALAAFPTNIPSILIWGENDVALSKELATLSGQLVPHLKVVFVEGASHWVQQDAPEFVNKTMENFYLSLY